MEALRSGRPLRVVMLGDSIVNDTSNSAWDVLLERLYPKARIEIITSVRGGTGCQYYRQENRVEQYVIRHKPDLLVIGGISNGFDVEAIRSVIQQVRRRISPEVLVLSDPAGVHGDPRAWPLMMIEPGKKGEEMRKLLAAIGPYRMGLGEMATAENVEYFDMATIWDACIAHSGKPYEYYLRDPVHTNERGRQILARMLVAFFAPHGNVLKLNLTGLQQFNAGNRQAGTSLEFGILNGNHACGFRRPGFNFHDFTVRESNSVFVHFVSSW